MPGEPGPRLSQLSVTDVTTSSLRLNWEAPPGAFDSFLLRYGVPAASVLEPHPRPLLQRELAVPGTRLSAVLRDLRPGTLYSLTLYGLRGPHQADSVQGTARTLSPGEPGAGSWCVCRAAACPGREGEPEQEPRPMPSPSFRHPFPSVLESPRDLQFSEIGETSAKVSWTPPLSRADSFKVSYQLVDGGDPFCPCPRWSQVPCALHSAHPAALLASRSLSSPLCFQGSHGVCRWAVVPGPSSSGGWSQVLTMR